MGKTLAAFVILAASLLAPAFVRAEDGANLIRDPGFEDAPDASAAYGVFIGPESKDKNCRYTIVADTLHTGKQAALMQADDFARFSVGPRAAFPVVAGDTYRIGIWIKAGADFQMQPGSPGLALRVRMTTGTPPVPAVVPFFFIYPNNTVSQAGPPGFAPLNTASDVSVQWTHMEAIVKVPTGVDSLAPEFFFWHAKGSLYLDDFSFQKADPATPMTPLTGDTPAATP